MQGLRPFQYPQAIAAVGVLSPASVSLGESHAITIRMAVEDGVAVHGVQPARIIPTELEGRARAVNGSHCLRNGVLTLEFGVVISDEPGR